MSVMAGMSCSVAGRRNMEVVADELEAMSAGEAEMACQEAVGTGSQGFGSRNFVYRDVLDVNRTCTVQRAVVNDGLG